MIVCEFCSQLRQNGECGLGLPIAKGMKCREFEPGLERFCADSKDFVSPRQITEMAAFFGIKGMELKKVRQMASREEVTRL